MNAELRRRFEHHPPSDPRVVEAHENVRAACLRLAELLDRLLPACAERDRALDAVDDACQHANAAIARTQLDLEPG